MTATPTDRRAQHLEPNLIEHVTGLLERGSGAQPSRTAVLANQHLLDALDRGDYRRFAVWPVHDPVGVAHVSVTGTLVPAGDPAAGAPLADFVEGGGWRVLIGSAGIANAVLEAVTRGLFRRRPHSREQRFMTCERFPAPSILEPPGLRPAHLSDLAAVTELACRLHVEDRMGPPLSRSGRSAVRGRMRDSIRRGDTWIVEEGGDVVAKFDLSLRSRRRGAQVAGVYVDAAARGRGIATGGVAALTRRLLDDGLPGVTLHVRADNATARQVYQNAGFNDRGAWTLALR